MGIVKRQVAKNVFLSLVGTLVGALSMVFIYPLDLALKGTADGILYLARLLFPIASLGTGAVMVRLVPYVGDDFRRARQQLFTKSLKVVTTFLAVVFVIVVLFQFAVSGLSLNSGYSDEFVFATFAVLCSLTLCSLLKTNLINHQRIAMPVLLNDLLIKISLPLLIILAFYGFLNQQTFVYSFMASYAMTVVLLLIYSKAIGALEFSTAPIRLKGMDRKEVLSIAGFSIFGLLGSSMVTSTDVVFINSWLSDEVTAIYTFGLFAAGVMKIPERAISNILLPEVTEAWKARKMDHLGQLYRESSIGLTLVGGVVWLGMMFCLPHFYLLTEGTAKYASGYWPALLLGAGLFFDLTAGINTVLIGYSDYYRWNILFAVLAGILNVFLNYIFVVILGYGLVGAAIGSATALFVYNVMKATLIYQKMKLSPFNLQHLGLIGVFSIASLVTWAIPTTSIPLADITIKGAVLCLTVVVCIYVTPLVPYIRKLLRVYLSPKD